MPLYENVYIARQEISHAQVDELTEQFTGLITEGGGTISKTEYWGVRNLAYRIKKNRKGHYVLLNIDAPAQAVQELERNMRLSEDVLRYLTLRVDALSEEPSVMMRSRRDDRGGRFARERNRRREETEPRAEPKKDAEPPKSEGAEA